MSVAPSIIMLVLLLLIVVVVIVIAAATRTKKDKFRGSNDARNFEDDAVFYPGDAVVKPSSTPPPRQPDPEAPLLRPQPTRAEDVASGESTAEASKGVISDPLLQNEKGEGGGREDEAEGTGRNRGRV